MSLKIPKSRADNHLLRTTNWLVAETFLGDHYSKDTPKPKPRLGLQSSSYAYHGRLNRVGTWCSFHPGLEPSASWPPPPNGSPESSCIQAAEWACYRLLRVGPRQQSVSCGRYRVIKHLKSFGSSLLVSWTRQTTTLQLRTMGTLLRSHSTAGYLFIVTTTWFLVGYTCMFKPRN